MAPVRGKACNYRSDVLLIAANVIEITEPRIGDRVNRISLLICEIAPSAHGRRRPIQLALSRLRFVSRETIFFRNKLKPIMILKISVTISVRRHTLVSFGSAALGRL